MAENLRIFGTNFDTVNALKVTSRASGNPQLLYTTGSTQLLLQNKTVTPGAQAQTVEADQDYYGLASVTVNAIPSNYIIPSGQISISRNGEYNVAAYSTANVNVTFTPNNQAKNASPSGSQQVITADTGYDGLSSVTISAVSLQNKTATPSASQQSIIADSGYNGLGTVTIDAISLQSKTVSPGQIAISVTPDNNYSGLSDVTVQTIPAYYINSNSFSATATENDIIYGVTAYGQNGLTTGTLVSRTYYEGIGTPSNDMGNIGDIYFEIG